MKTTTKKNDRFLMEIVLKKRSFLKICSVLFRNKSARKTTNPKIHITQIAENILVGFRSVISIIIFQS